MGPASRVDHAGLTVSLYLAILGCVAPLVLVVELLSHLQTLSCVLLEMQELGSFKPHFGFVS